VSNLVKSAVNTTLPAFAAERRAAAPAAAPLLLGASCPPLSIVISPSCPHGAQQQTRRRPLLRSNDETDRCTDRRTDGHPTVT